ncbi:membrane-bound lytic murein transglycosylase F [Rodentibacter pneumotropicus]|uniref:Membrane-bound lytic murein transglycosylase F n=1 Tax=Rodentibacter pneumotropicus TaxID=758 RepID=A0A3S4W4F9_9PAST|nr:membrane-bound lytic murein transglycosylase F [Rodentibacter pneumotropicus]
MENNQIDFAAANLLFHPRRAEQFQIGPAYTSASWQLVYKKGENRPKDLSQIKQEITIAGGEELNELLTQFKKNFLIYSGKITNGLHKKNY